jgi:hypothetical protein
MRFLLITLLLVGCTVEVKPLPKPKPKVIVVHRGRHHVHVHRPTPESSAIPKLQPPDESGTKLLPRPTPNEL